LEVFMKITDIKVHNLEIPFPRELHSTWGHGRAEKFHGVCLAEVQTDEGVTGYGAAEAMWGWGAVHRAVIESMLKPRLLGKDPFATEQHIMDIRDVPGRAWMVENALWDIIGKVAKMPIYKMWGGFQNRVKAYAAWAELRAPEKAAEDALVLVEKGFKGVKLRMHHPNMADDLALVKAVRKSVGDKLTIMVDANQATAPYRTGALRTTSLWDFARAHKMALALEELDVYWLEEPLPLHDYRDLARLAAAVDIPIAGGEINREIFEFKTFLDQECYDVLQPNCTMAEGMFQVRKIAALAEVNHKLCVPHAWVQGPGFYANLHVAGAVRNCPWIEFAFDPPVLTPENFHSIITEPPMIDAEGYVPLPEKPGLGVEINWETVKRFSK
jgi:L-alanine-DL-glutamate epimerase-like enolase superfamily enzyme